MDYQKTFFTLHNTANQLFKFRKKKLVKIKDNTWDA